MNKFSAAVLSASFMALASTAADAQSRWPSWYVGLHGSLTFVGDENLDGNPNVSSFNQDNGVGYGVSIGYRPRIETGEWSNMRIELEWHHQSSDVNKLAITGGTTKGAGSVRANSGMLNVFYDAATSMPEWRPYVGVGLGFSKVKLQNSTADFGASSDQDTVFAWNAMVGLGYIPESLPFTELNIGYRYFSTANAEFDLTGGGSFEMEYDSHNIEAGMKFLF